MSRRFSLFLLALSIAATHGLRAETPPLLAVGIQRWTAGQGDLAFTQQTRTFRADGTVKNERMERYDPSLPDSRRWRLVEIDGQPATDEQRQKWESRKNGKPRTRVDESPSKYLDLDHATVIGETSRDVRFKIPVRPTAEHLLSVEGIDVVITVDKRSGNISGVGAALRDPIQLLLGLVQVTDLDVDLRINPVEEGSSQSSDEVESGSTARVMVSRLGRPVEYNWSDFRRVAPYAGI
jgi:hypothetical protein